MRQLLKGYEVRSYPVQIISLRLSDDEGRPIQLGEPELYAPELVVHEGDGSVTATVTIGPHSGCYLVSLRNGPDLQTVREPQQVADLILTTQPGGRS
ncbi:hypothetical protein OG339_22345 [Streptosporangium sp. NBC_01495]|uniref:hypothetical protein n=1 Tax=Streptosporangium sp. NBC_01495 TaxID=2903899 RepID=UPI002E357689|nr:hypothetical protein [Streptosporangium sp. NBC_01495]